MGRLWASRLMVAMGMLLIGLGLIYGGLTEYLQWQEGRSPSTQQVLVLPDGREIPLVQPDPFTPRPVPTHEASATSTATGEQADGSGVPSTVPPALPALSRPPEESATPLTPSTRSPEAAAPSPQAPAATPPGRVAPPSAAPATPPRRVATPPPPSSGATEMLPPLRITIPRLGVNWPVVLSTNDHLPHFKAVGWFLGSAYPGTAGNIVLFGHLDGPYSTFARLHELRAGDEVRVITEGQTHRYGVRRAFETTLDDVAVLAPSAGATATFITCSGRWNSTLHAYDHRLIVLADYLGP